MRAGSHAEACLRQCRRRAQARSMTTSPCKCLAEGRITVCLALVAVLLCACLWPQIASICVGLPAALLSG